MNNYNFYETEVLPRYCNVLTFCIKAYCKSYGRLLKAGSTFVSFFPSGRRGRRPLQRLQYSLCSVTTKGTDPFGLKKPKDVSPFCYLSFIDNNFDIPLSSIVIPYTVSAASIVPFLCVITKNCVFFVYFFK